MSTHTNIENPTPEQGLKSIIGHRFIYTYANGWQYEMYVKNSTTIDYRIHSGMVGGRWVKDQQVDLVGLGRGVFKVSWNEPTGTSVVVNIIPEDRVVHGTIFFLSGLSSTGRKRSCSKMTTWIKCDSFAMRDQRTQSTSYRSLHTSHCSNLSASTTKP